MIKKIAIRADGNSHTGMGHIMRCLVICKEFIRRNIETIFLVKYDTKLINILDENKIKYLIIENTNLKEEAINLCKIIKELNIDGILIDSYWINNEYLREIYNHVNLLISIDDNNLYDYPSHIIINGNIYGNDINYKLINENTKLLLGSDYAILSDEFTNETPIKIKDNVKNILITMGGCDINNYTPTVINSISKINIPINVIIGPQFNNKKAIENIALSNQKINLFYNPKSMKTIMKNNDIAISASGTTTYELGVLGIPTILIYQADNQENIAKKTSELGMMINLGYFEDVKEAEIYDSLLDLVSNKKKREDMSNKCIKNIGRTGVIKIVDEILKYKS